MVTFTATVSDPENDTLAYQWQHWGDTTIKLVSPNSPSLRARSAQPAAMW